MEICSLGVRSYQEVRALQECLVRARVENRIEDTLIFCEHPPTLTLGRRTRKEDLLASNDEWDRLGVDVQRVDRGGGPTYHGPGQLLIYPVISLRANRLGVKRFVGLGLQTISDSLQKLGLQTVVLCEPAGVWVLDSNKPLCDRGVESIVQQGRKISSVGLRITRGISNHGFSLNITSSLKPYSLFVPCGLHGAQMTSLAEELRVGDGILETLTELIAAHWRAALCANTHP